MSDLPSSASRLHEATEASRWEPSSTQVTADSAAERTSLSFFFSYAGIDRDVAAQVVYGLQTAGVRIWWDQQQIEWGTSWVAKLQQALADCQGFVLLVGATGMRKWVKQEFEYALKRSVEGQLQIFPLLLPGVTPDILPPFLSTTQAKSLPNTLNEVDYEALAAELSNGAPLSLPPLSPDTCPFPGLEAFGEEDAPFFVGRQKETLKVVSALGQGPDGRYRRWLHLHGTSGVGKSSLVKAGIIPTIKQGWVGSVDVSTWKHWVVVEPMRPGSDPVLNLADVLSKSLNQEGRRLPLDHCHARLRQDEQGLQELLREWGSKQEAVVLVVDQLEELFTLTTDNARRTRFDALLANALTDLDGPLHLITTIRTDFMMRFNLVPRLQALLDEQAFAYFLTPMDEFGLKDVVMTPAKLARLTWSDPQLPEDIVKEVSGEPGALPLVENLLRLLWMKARKRQSTSLSRQDYNALGKVGGALAKSADALLEQFGKEGKGRALRLLSALVNVGTASRETQDTRRTLTKVKALEVAGKDQQAETIVNQLSGLRGLNTPGGTPAFPRLIVVWTRQNVDGSTTDQVDLAHETLLRYNRDEEPYWPTLRNEITTQRTQIENRQLAEALAKQWHKQGRSRWHGLATRSQLKVFLKLTDLEEEGAAYVAASRRFANGLKSVLALTAIVLIPYLAVWGWAKVKFHGLETRLAAKVLVTQLGFDLISPEMVPITAGRFRREEISNPSSTHEVTLQKDFKIGKYEVTFDDYEPFVKVTGHGDGIIDHRGWGTGRRPAINVSWDDAKHYVDWLSKLTGKRYRLPTEAEWEYAARAGTNTIYWLESGSKWKGKQTAPVGSFPPNKFGLYDTDGNVWEWVEDCWYKDYEGAPIDGSAWLPANGKDCESRVLRIGSWNNNPVNPRVSYLGGDRADHRGNNIGFRLAQDIEPEMSFKDADVSVQLRGSPPGFREELKTGSQVKIIDHLLQGTKVIVLETPNKDGAIIPDAIVIHSNEGTFKGAITWLLNPDSGVSAHIVIGRAGEIVQMAPFNIRTWHTGRGEWNGRRSFNDFSIGIELVSRDSERFTEVQIARLIEVCALLVKEYNVTLILGHAAIDLRKSDPGPSFPYAEFRKSLLSMIGPQYQFQKKVAIFPQPQLPYPAQPEAIEAK